MHKEHEYWLCVDCTLYACNGDLSGIDSDARAKQVEEGVCSLGNHIVPDFDSETGEGHDEFSNVGCDACGSGLAGEFHRFASLAETPRLAIGSRVREVLFGALDKDRLTVKLSMCDDYPHGDVCMAVVEGRWAEAWAEHDQTIAGDSWENPDGDDFVYAMPCNSATLVDELKAEGYSVDASEWSEPDYDEPCGQKSCNVCYARAMNVIESEVQS